MGEQASIFAKSRATSKGQATIPKSVRDALGIEEGTELNWVLTGRDLKVVAETLRIGDFAGFLGKPPNGRHVTIEEMNEGIGQAVAERFGRKTAQ
jgi:AbrB family looped-hinge helix DNA binding protein